MPWLLLLLLLLLAPLTQPALTVLFLLWLSLPPMPFPEPVPQPPFLHVLSLTLLHVPRCELYVPLGPSLPPPQLSSQPML